MAISIVDPGGLSYETGTGNSFPLLVGNIPIAGAKRFAHVTVPSSITFQSFTGWTKISDAIVAGRRIGLFSVVLTSGIGDGTMTLSTVSDYTMVVWTTRSWDPTFTPTIANGGNTATSNTHVAPTITTGYGVLMCIFIKSQNPNASSGLNNWLLPSGMTQLHSFNDVNDDNGQRGLFCWEPRASGASGTRTATSQYNGATIYPGAWIASSVFIRGLVDQVVVLGKITETNTLRPVTPVFGPTTVVLGKIHETSVVRPITNPLQTMWRSPPVNLKEVPLTGSVITWDATIPTGSSMVVETSTDNGATWQVATKAEPIERLVIGTTVAKTVMARVIMRKQTLASPTPVLRRLEFRVALDASRDEVMPLGVFTLNDTEIIDTVDGLALQLSGADLSRKMDRNRWEQTYVLYNGTNTADAIKRIIANRSPGSKYNFASTEETCPLVFLGEDNGNSPLQDAQNLAISAGMELYLDPTGTWVLRPEPDPEVDSPVWTIEDTVNPTIISLRRKVTDENTFNRVVVVGEGSGLDYPARGIWQDDDPSSPTYILGPYGTVTQVIRSSMVLTDQQAYEAARAQGLRVKGATEAIELEIIPMSALEPGDIITIMRTKSKVWGQFIIDSFSIPLGEDGTMRITARRQRL